MALRNVVSSLNVSDGKEQIGPDVLVWKYPGKDILKDSLLTVEPGTLCVLRSRGAVLNVYSPGQHILATPDVFLLGNVYKDIFYDGQSPWQFEVLYVNCMPIHIEVTGNAVRWSNQFVYRLDYYVQVQSPADALRLTTTLPYLGNLNRNEVNEYAEPVVAKAVNRYLDSKTSIEDMDKTYDAWETAVLPMLGPFLQKFGLTLLEGMVEIVPRVDSDPVTSRMRQIMALIGAGLTPDQAVQAYMAMVMAEKGVITAPNMATGHPYIINGVLPGINPSTGNP